jgi:hypothetical protein
MKTPFLFVTAAALLAITATSALADGPYSSDRPGGPYPGDRPGDDGRLMRASDRAWQKLKAAGIEAREGLGEAMEAIQADIKDFRHQRHFLMSEHVHAIKKGDEVQLLYCDSKINNGIGSVLNMFERTTTIPTKKVKQKCQRLHKAGSFKVAELKSCVNKVGDNNGPGLILNRQLTATAGNGYGYDKYQMFNTPKEQYIDYLEKCERVLSKRRIATPAPVAAPAPVPAPAPREPVEEFKPIEEKPGDEAKPFDIPASNL